MKPAGEDNSMPVFNKWIAAAIVTIGIFMALLDTTIVDIVLPKMMSTFEEDLYGIQWVIISYFLGSVISMCCVGWLGDRYGAKMVFLVGLAIFTAFSALCGMAPSSEVMHFGRFIQGVGEGFIVPAGLVVLYESFPKEEHGIAMGFYGIGGAFAPAVGPSLGGFITEHMTWRWIFYINVPLGLFAFFAGWFMLRRDTSDGARPPFDRLGFILMAIAMSALVIFTTKGQEKGWLESDVILALIVIFAVAFPLFIVWQLRTRHPLVDLSLFRNRTYALCITLFSAFSFATYGFFLLLPVYMEKLRGYSTLTAGLVLLPGSLAGALAIFAVGVGCDRWKPRVLLVITIAGAMIGCFLFHTGLEVPKEQIALDYGVWMVFIASSFIPINIIALSRLRDNQLNMGSTMLNVLRLLMGSIGTSYSTALLSSKGSEYFTVLSAKVTYGEPAAMQLLGRAWYANGGNLVGPALMKFQAQLKGLITAYSTSYAFEAVFRTLGIWLLASLVLAVVILLDRREQAGAAKRKVAVH